METKTSNRLALLGLVGTVPALIIVLGGFWQVMFGKPNIWETLFHLTAQSLIIHPVLVLGGLFLAIVFNIAPILSVKFQPSQDSISATVKVRWRLLNVAVFMLSSFLLCLILMYAFVENFRIVAR